jgi:hypothetical protein
MKQMKKLPPGLQDNNNSDNYKGKLLLMLGGLWCKVVGMEVMVLAVEEEEVVEIEEVDMLIPMMGMKEIVRVLSSIVRWASSCVRWFQPIGQASCRPRQQGRQHLGFFPSRRPPLGVPPLYIVTFCGLIESSNSVAIPLH